MKNSSCFIAIFVIGVTLLLSCHADPDARKKLKMEFQNLNDPGDHPVQWKPSSIPDSTRTLSPVPPSGAGILVRVVRHSKIVWDTLTATGMLTTVSDSLLNLVTGIPDTITIGVTLPAGLHLKPVAIRATLIVKDSSSAGGANQDVTILTGLQRCLYLRYVWKASAGSLNLGWMGGDVVMIQDSLSRDSLYSITKSNPNKLIAVKAFLKRGNLQVHAPPGQVMTLGLYRAFVQSSLYQSVRDPGSDARKGYILRALVLLR